MTFTASLSCIHKYSHNTLSSEGSLGLFEFGGFLAAFQWPKLGNIISAGLMMLPRLGHEASARKPSNSGTKKYSPLSVHCPVWNHDTRGHVIFLLVTTYWVNCAPLYYGITNKWLSVVDTAVESVFAHRYFRNHFSKMWVVVNNAEAWKLCITGWNVTYNDMLALQNIYLQGYLPSAARIEIKHLLLQSKHCLCFSYHCRKKMALSIHSFNCIQLF